MIDVTKYMHGEYVKGVHDCWTLMQEIYSEHHSIELPDFPIFGLDEDEYPEYMINNMYAEKIDAPEVGCIVHKSGMIEHVGYCLDGKHYIHRILTETRCDRIKAARCTFYRVLKRD